MPPNAPITVTQTHGCLRVAGVFALLCSMLGAVVLFTDMGGGSPAWAAAVALGLLVLIPAGLVLLLGSAGVTVDAQQGQVTAWKRLAGFTVQERMTPLPLFQNVAILRERVRGQDAFAFLYHVQLTGPSHVQELLAPGNYETARDQADAVAELTGLARIDGEFKPAKR